MKFFLSLLLIISSISSVHSQIIRTKRPADSIVKIPAYQEGVNMNNFSSNKFLNELGASNNYDLNSGKINLSDFGNFDTRNSIVSNAFSSIGTPTEMLDKYNLKPNPGSLTEGLPNFSDDLLKGKINVSIPLLEFEYYDYKIPVFINNRYPQTIVPSAVMPSFYLNSNVGGDWTLSIDQFKVSRQINGNPDENPSNGYFSPNSLSKLNNITGISNSDIHNGLKGEWDPAIDVFHFSTPSISGSFLIDPRNDYYEVLSENKFHVEFELVDDELNEFIIVDPNGIKYYFGGDSNAIEVTQSKTDVYNYGMYVDHHLGKGHVRAIFEVESYPNANEVMSYKLLPAFSNVYADFPASSSTPWNETFNSILENESISGLGSRLTLLSHSNVGPHVRYFYALIDNSASNFVSELSGALDDEEMRREEINTAWYLKQIELVNKKKINFSYNSNWLFHPSFASNKIRANKLYSTNNGYSYPYISGEDGLVSNVLGLGVYACFPEVHQDLKFPVNESHTQTYNFVKKPKLARIYDEDYYQLLEINYAYNNLNKQAPYADSPSIAQGVTPVFGQTPYLIDNLKYKINNCFPISECQTEIKFNNYSAIGIAEGDDGVPYRFPRFDRSYLDAVIIDNQKRYDFEYVNSRLKKIHYPTGGTKEFFSTQVNNNTYRYNFWKFHFYHPRSYLSGSREAVVESVVTTSENNITTERYEYEDREVLNGEFNAFRTFKPESTSCTQGANIYSSAPLNNSISSTSGLIHGETRKYVNDELQLSVKNKTLEQGFNYTSNLFRLTDETVPEYNDGLNIPKTYFDSRIGFLEEQNAYKTIDAENDLYEVNSQTTIERTFSSVTGGFVSVYLAKVEAGPWDIGGGVTRRGYSIYARLAEDEPNTETKIEKQFFDNGTFIDNEITIEYKRIRLPSLGLNSRYISKVNTTDSEGNNLITKFNTPVEIEGLYSTTNSVDVQNPEFDNLLSNNRLPIVETLRLQDGKLTNTIVQEFKLTPQNGNGESYAVQKTSKELESDLELVEADYTSQYVNSSDPNNLIFDPNLKDRVHYDLYDDIGRLLEFHSLEDGTYTSIIWGYKNQYPIVVAKNARYSEIQSFEQQIKLASHNYSNPELLNIFETMRAYLPNAQITGHTRKAKKLTSVTDAKGNTNYYEYDELDRLLKIRDRNNNIVNQYRYHYQNVIDNPITAYIETEINEADNSVTFLVQYVTGGSGNYSYNWSVIDGPSTTSDNTQTSYTVFYDCLTGLDHIDVELIIQDTQDENNSTTLTRGSYSLPCYPLISASSLGVTEIRDNNEGESTFEGIKLDVNGLTGGSGNLKFDWEYKTNQTSFQHFITAFSNQYFVPANFTIMGNVCQKNIRMKCVITDLETGQIYTIEQSNNQYLDCFDNPQ